MIRRPPRSTQSRSSAASDVYKRQVYVSNKKETNYDPQTTYVYQDYLDLVTYSLALRFVAPIWGDIHNRLNSEFGKDAKEVYSMEILYDTCMVSNPEKNYICTAENRLREFIANTKLKLETNAAVSYTHLTLPTIYSV